MVSATAAAPSGAYFSGKITREQLPPKSGCKDTTYLNP